MINYLSYSGFSLFVSCQYAYWHGYVNGTEKGIEDRLTAVYGIAVGRIFENFYNQKLWKDPSVRESLIRGASVVVQDVLAEEGERGTLVWQSDEAPKAPYASVAELEADVRDGVSNGLAAIKHHRLLGPRAVSEVKLNLKDGMGNTLGGRADFLVVRATSSDLVILDGKGSRHLGKYADPRQLTWYAMLLRGVEGRLPDKLGFLYWRAPTKESVDWVEVSAGEVADLYEEAEEALRKIKELEKKAPARTSFSKALRVFTPKPSDGNCRFCGYLKNCPPGMAHVKGGK